MELSSSAQSAVPLSSATTSALPMAKNRALLEEAVESVVNTFAKHARGYGRGQWPAVIMSKVLWQYSTSYVVYTEL